MFEERYKKLNDEQKQAVDQLDGPVLVVAGPGSGKTELLSMRAANILKKMDINPQNILLLTFTDSASQNMRNRLLKLVGPEAHKISIHTFHSFASYILNKHENYFFKNISFSPASEIDQLNIVENIVKRLERNNPLGTFHPEQGYVYIKDIISKIKDLKKGNLRPDDFAKKLRENKKHFKDLEKTFYNLENIVGKRKFQEVTSEYIKIYNELKKISGSNEIAQTLFYSLEETLRRASLVEKTSSLTSWKNEYLKKDESGKTILKDGSVEAQKKLFALADVYKKYEDELSKKALFDFEDMVLKVSVGLKENKELKNELQEIYQYIMLDEFQDTNEAQFDMVLNLCRNDLNNSPNILAVGDDDQSIYKFQGAEIQNIYAFTNNFENVNVIVLNENYRSTQNILDFSKKIIEQAETRLSNIDKKIDKNILAKNIQLGAGVGNIYSYKFENDILEYNYVATEIVKLLKNGIDPNEIAVICRKHANLKNLAEILSSHSIPFSYEKMENILDKKYIKEIISILRFLENTNDSSLLPEIISYDFWKVDRIDVWKIALEVKNNRKTWLENLALSGNEKLVAIANFLIDLSIEAKSIPLEYIIDKIVNYNYKDFYLKPKENCINLDFLFSLRTFIKSIKEFKKSNTVYVKDLESYLDVYQKNKISLSMETPFSILGDRVKLLTAHKAKGLEFEYVFVLSVSQDVWGKNARASKISFPVNIKLSPDKDNSEDKIRLLYVALTRAKHTLYLTHSNEKLEFLDQESDELENIEISTKTIEALKLSNKNAVEINEVEFLKKVLAEYKMSATHMNSFLNFVNSGPDKFIEKNILHFPTPINLHAAYGSAMHKTLEKYFKFFEINKKTQYIKDIISNFHHSLEGFGLKNYELENLKKDGEIKLKKYIKYLEKRKIIPNTKVEVKFGTEVIQISNFFVTGNIDKMEFINDEIIITDLKTGDSFESFEDKNATEYEKMKMHFYKYQLIFYTLMVKNSSQFKNYKVQVACLEFVEDCKNLQIKVTEKDEKRVIDLGNIIYKKILNLDFPDISKYPKTLKGIIQFEEDLLSGTI